MYPFIRMLNAGLRARKMPKLDLFEPHISQHMCMPWDIDMWMELNNGRTLSLLDLGRIPLAIRTGLLEVLRHEKWGLAVAGTSVRYRRRVRTLERFEMRSRLVTWDDKFFYLEQGMWARNGDCANHALFRTAVTDRNGLVKTQRVRDAMGVTQDAPAVPDWVAQWIEAEAARPWPPMEPVPHLVETPSKPKENVA
jgi:acyl-CoA thioesterase FadM